jgi:tetrahydrodipicolinate N-succinyltransferase
VRPILADGLAWPIGTVVGDGAIIGMGAVIGGEVPPLAVAVGQKWWIGAPRNADHYARLDDDGCYGAVNGAKLGLDAAINDEDA